MRFVSASGIGGARAVPQAPVPLAIERTQRMLLLPDRISHERAASALPPFLHALVGRCGLAHLLELVVDAGGAQVPSLISVLAPRGTRRLDR